MRSVDPIRQFMGAPWPKAADRSPAATISLGNKSAAAPISACVSEKRELPIPGHGGRIVTLSYKNEAQWRARRAYNQTALAALLAIAYPNPGLAAGDATHGAKVYQDCMICHSLDKNEVGPRHRGVFGRKAGSLADYDYSPALNASNIVWNEATLDKWLTDPQALVPGTKMTFSVDDAQDRADVIAFLKEKAGVGK
jgi:cytochrome c